MNTSPELVRAFAPTGALRAPIDLGNPLLAGRDAAGHAVGVSVDAVTAGPADLGFFATDPKRGEGIHFTPLDALIAAQALQRHGIRGAAVAAPGD
jgi:polar amino acid transport system substrate-binding protein